MAGRTHVSQQPAEEDLTIVELTHVKVAKQENSRGDEDADFQSRDKTALPVSQHEDESDDDDKAEKWYKPRRNVYKIIATFLSFFIMGMNDAGYGAMVPHLEQYYHIEYLVVSLTFLTPYVGYILAAVSTSVLNNKIGKRGCAMAASLSYLTVFIVLCLHPPYPVIVVFLICAGLGTGIHDATWNAWIGNLANATQLLGIMHGCYGLGAVAAPIIVSAMTNRYGLQWYEYYYLMIILAVINLAIATAAFWNDGRLRTPMVDGTQVGKHGSLREALRQRIALNLSIFMLLYMGIEVTLGGWIISFMQKVRHGSNSQASFSATGFWLGLTTGRMALGFVTPMLGVKKSVLGYLGLSIILQLLFWLIPSFIVSSLMVSFLGFFLGPLFPAAVVVATTYLPPHLHVAAIGFVAAFGGTGACIFPFVTGATAQAAGVMVLQPIILAMLLITFVLWIVAVPPSPRKWLENVKGSMTNLFHSD